MQPNHLLALIGLALIATSATGLILVEEKKPGEGKVWDLLTFHAAFPLQAGTVSESGSTPDGSTDTTTLTISDVNLSGANVVVSWTDNRPRFSRNAANVEVEVSGPQDQTGSDQGTQGSISIDIGRLNVPPNETDVEAVSADEAVQDTFEDNPTTTNGTGQWTITITVTRAGISVPFRRGSVDWTVTIEFEHYSLVLTQPEAEGENAQETMRSSSTFTPGVY